MNGSPESGDELWVRYLEWCSAQIARHFLSLSPEQVWERAQRRLPGERSEPASYARLVNAIALDLFHELGLPGFAEWKELHEGNPAALEAQVVGTEVPSPARTARDGFGQRGAGPIRAVRLPSRFYLSRRSYTGLEIHDVLPWQGAEHYVTDGERFGVLFTGGEIAWFEASRLERFREDFTGVDLDALVREVLDYTRTNQALRRAWQEGLLRREGPRAEGEGE